MEKQNKKQNKNKNKNKTKQNKTNVQSRPNCPQILSITFLYKSVQIGQTALRNDGNNTHWYS